MIIDTATDNYNKYCDNVIIAIYPTMAGGKFLINCLGLSDDCYLRDNNMVAQQLDKKLSPADKLSLLIEKLDQTILWNDFGMKDIELFVYSDDPLFKFSSVVSRISYEKKYFFYVAHDYSKYVRLKQIWPNAKIIYFNCTDKFINWRLGLDPSVDRTHYLSLSQDFPVNYEQLFDLDHTTIYWNANWYLDEVKFLEQIKKIYNILHLNDFNLEFIKIFRSKYLDTLVRIQKKKNQL